MPDYTDFLVPRDSEYEELFDSTKKFAVSSPFTKEFDIKGATGLIFFQKATIQGTTARIITSEDISGDPNVLIDDNLGNSIAESGTGSNTVVIDFQSIAVRDISSKASTGNSTNSSGGGSASVSISYSTDNISYSGGGTICSSGGSPSSPNTCGPTTRTDVAVNMRYAKLTLSRSSVNTSNPSNTVFECWEGGTGLGTATVTFEVFRDLDSTWDAIDLGVTLPTNSSSTGSTSTTQTLQGASTDPKRVFPKGASRIRAKMSVTDACDATVGVLKIFG